MNKLKLIILLILSAALFHSCKKDTITADTTTNASLQAIINGDTWVPDTVSTTITYNTASQVKTLYFIGTSAQKQVVITIKLNNSTNDAGFTAGTYNVDNTGNVIMAYNVQQKNAQGNYVFVPFGSVTAGSGSVTITSVDATKHLIVGTFNLISRSPNYDSNGNLISVNVATVQSGVFNNLPYSFQTN